MQAERLPWWPGTTYAIRQCHGCGADHESAVLDLTRPAWCSLLCLLGTERTDREEGG